MTHDKKTDEFSRNERPERPRRPRPATSDRFSPEGEGGHPRAERAFNAERPRGDRPRRPYPEGPGRSPEGEDDRPYAERSFDPERPRGAAGALIELDLELMKLLVRRAKLVSRVRGGKTHAATPQAVQAEKAVRRAFEKNAATFSKDPRFTRALFDLLQDVRVLSHEESEKEPGFHLSPPRKPVRVELPAPTQSDAALLWAALAAFSGRETRLESVAPTKDLVQGLRALMDCGAKILREEPSPAVGVVNVAAGPKPTFAGKTVHLGDSFSALCLTIFAALGDPGICKLTGGSILKEQDLSFLHHTLPGLGARLAHVMTHTRSLPASLECSGLLPESFRAPEEIPAEALRALLLAPLLWNRPFALDMGDVPAELGAEALHALEPIFAANPQRVRREDHLLRYTPGDVSVPELPALPSDPTVCAYFAALPLLAGGGEVKLVGYRPEESPESAEFDVLLRGFGLTLEHREDGLLVRAGTAPAVMPASPLRPSLLPLWACLAVRAGHALPDDSTVGDLPVDFREHLHLDRAAGPAVPWVCPDGFWGMAYALAAFIRSGLRLANPSLVTDTAPAFWSVFNRLPTPPNPALPPVKENKDDAPIRRRVRAD